MNESAVQAIEKVNTSIFTSHSLVILNHSAPFGGLMRAELPKTHGKKVCPVGKKLDQLDVNKLLLLILNP